MAQSGNGAMVWGGRMPAVGEGYTPSVGGVGRQNAPNLQPLSPVPARTTQPADDRALLDDLLGRSAPRAAGAASIAPGAAGAHAGPPPPLDAPSEVDTDPARFGAAEPVEDPWQGLKRVTPGAIPPPQTASREATSPQLIPHRGIVAALGGQPQPARRPDAVPGRGRLEQETPSGYTAMPRSEAMCRKALRQMGVKFVDVASVGKGAGCGISYPVKVLEIARGVRMQPAATLNCQAAARISKWVEDEVKPAARWRLWTRPTAVLNASSYRCSRIAGSRTISEHASGNALDVRGFKFADGSTFDVEKKGFFSFRQKGFQKSVRHSACRYFGTVLGPGYNRAHADHLHLDAKNRRRGVCK
ncbi:MAG TPA: extensin family protein [Aurantimonas sp.]